MFLSIIPLVMLAAVDAAPVSVSTLAGTTHTGTLLSLSTETLSLETPSGPQDLATEDLMLVEFREHSRTENSDAARITLVDNSTILASTITLEGPAVRASSLGLGDVTLATQALHDIRWGEADDAVGESWSDIRNRTTRDDLLVFRKGDVLDYVAGSISAVSAESVTLVVRGKSLSAPLDRIFGVVLTSRPKPSDRPVAVLTTTAGDTIQVNDLTLTGTELALRLPIDLELTVPIEHVSAIDFGGGRVRFLADLPFDDSNSRQPGPDETVNWFTCRNAPAGTGGRDPLRIGEETYRKGLWLHSGAHVRFRLNREFRELRAMAGFDLTFVQNMPTFDPRVRLVILGDQRELFSQEFGWRDAPVPLIIELSDVREFVIRVESLGTAEGILEHFALGDAQVIR